MEKNKRFEKSKNLGLIGLFILVVTLFLSIAFLDVRYFSAGIIFFALTYWQHFVIWLIVMIRREIKPIDKILPVVNLILCFFIYIVLIVWGIALFLWHYDNNYLIDFLHDLVRKIGID